MKTALSVCIARLKHLDTGETQAMELVTSSMPPDLIGKLAVLLKEQDRLSAVDSLPGSRLRGLYDQFQSLSTPSKLTNNSNEWTDLRSGGFESFNLRWNLPNSLARGNPKRRVSVLSCPPSLSCSHSLPLNKSLKRGFLVAQW